MSLASHLAKFMSDIKSVNNTISIIHNHDNAGNFIFNGDQRQFVTEASYLKFFISWETFLESSFLDYLLGVSSITGNAPKRYIKPRDSTHAQEIILLFGNQKYFDWSVPENIRRIAKAAFENGFVFDNAIPPINTELLDLKTIRNAAAHLSSTTCRQLESLGQRILQKPCLNIKPYDLLVSINPSSNDGETIFQTYVKTLEFVAIQIANG